MAKGRRAIGFRRTNKDVKLFNPYNSVSHGMWTFPICFAAVLAGAPITHTTSAGANVEVLIDCLTTFGAAWHEEYLDSQS